MRFRASKTKERRLGQPSLLEAASLRDTMRVETMVGTPRCGVRSAQRADPTIWARQAIRVKNHANALRHDKLKRSVAITADHCQGVGLGAGVSKSLFVVCPSVVCALALLALSLALWCV